jgi:hypothetical protein
MLRMASIGFLSHNVYEGRHEIGHKNAPIQPVGWSAMLAREITRYSSPCEGFLVLIPDSPYDIFKFVRIRKLVLMGEPTTDARHLCVYVVYDRDGFLGCA